MWWNFECGEPTPLFNVLRRPLSFAVSWLIRPRPTPSIKPLNSLLIGGSAISMAALLTLSFRIKWKCSLGWVANQSIGDLEVLIDWQVSLTFEVSRFTEWRSLSKEDKKPIKYLIRYNPNIVNSMSIAVIILHLPNIASSTHPSPKARGRYQLHA